MMETNTKLPAIAVRLLTLIATTKNGMTAAQISTAAWEMSHDMPVSGTVRREAKGWWGTNLYGAHPMGMKNCGRDGLLERYCVKIGMKWLRNNVKHNGHPFAGLVHKEHSTKPSVEPGHVAVTEEQRPLWMNLTEVTARLNSTWANDKLVIMSRLGKLEERLTALELKVLYRR